MGYLTPASDILLLRTVRLEKAYESVAREKCSVSHLTGVLKKSRVYILVSTLFRSNDYSDTLDFRRGEWGRWRWPCFSFWRSLITIHNFNTYIFIRPLNGAPLAQLEARRLWCSITIHNFAARFARCSLVAPSTLQKIME